MKKRIFAAFFALIMLISALPCPLKVNAVNEMAAVLSGIDGDIILSCLDAIEDDFDHATVDWTVKGATAEAVGALSEFPYSVYSGSRSLLLRADGYTAGEEITLTKKPVNTADIKKYHYYCVTVLLPHGAGDGELTLTLTSGRTSYDIKASIAQGSWQTVFFDLSECTLSSKLTSVKLTVTAEKGGDHGFLVDVFGASSDPRAVLSAKTMSAEYTAEGAELFTDGDVLKLELNGEGNTVETSSPFVNDFTGTTGIKVEIQNNRSNCRRLTLYYTTLSSPEYSERYSLSKEIYGGDTTAVFPIPESYIGSFKLVFEGDCSGSLEIALITPTLCYSIPENEGRIMGCSLSRDKKTVSVWGEIDRDSIKKYTDCSVYLYELELWEEAGDITTKRPAVSESRLSGAEFSFSIPFSSDKDGLYKKYAAMIYYQGALVPIGQPTSVTNPEILSDYRGEYSADSIKGYYPIVGSTVLDGVGHTAVMIDLDRIISLGSSGTYTHKAGSDSCTLNSEYIAELDSKMKEYEACSVNVIFVIRSGYRDISLGSVITHPDADGGNIPAFNTESNEGIGALRAVCDFLAERYCTDKGVSANGEGFVVGCEINNALSSYNLGDTDLLKLVRSYSSALRTVYNTVRSVSSEVTVYASLGGEWNSNMTVSQRGSFDSKTVLESLALCISGGGDIGWGVCYDIFRENALEYWQDRDIDRTDRTPYITAANIEVLTDILSKSSLLYGGSERQIVLVQTEENTPSDENERIRLSADYAFSYLKLSKRSFSNIKAYIPSHSASYNDTLKYIDTVKAEAILEYAKELVGEELFYELTDSGEENKREIFEEKLSFSIPSAVKGETVLFSFSEESTPWRPLVNCTSAVGGGSLGERAGLLNIRLSGADPNELRGVFADFEGTKDISAAEYIGFDIQTAVLPDGVEELNVTVVLWSGSSYCSSSGRISVSEWTTVITDLRGYTKRSSCNRMSILVSGVDGQDIGEPTLLVGNIRAMSTVRSNSELDSAIRADNDEDTGSTVSVITVCAVCAALIISGSAETARIIKRRRNKIGDQ